MKLRDYQIDCIDTIDAQPPGAYLAQMATGLGKTVTFANLPRHGKRMLILSHREELVEQPRKYFDCSFGVERAALQSYDEEVVSASVQSLVRRLHRFRPDEFGLIICDEAHHAAANTYRKIFDHFRPEKLIGFTATPNRGDKVRLDTVFSKIIFQRDLRWGIEHGYLCNIFCRRVNIGYDLSQVRTQRGDYAPGELDEAMEGTADAIAQAYRELATGATLIFAVSVHHAEEIAKRIPGAVVVTGETKDRAAIIKAFTAGEIPCIVNCMVFTEGTDIPRVETVIIARPTQSESLYAQMVGRGLRLYPSKEKLNLIDCVGITGRSSLCTAPSLLGLDIGIGPTEMADKLNKEFGTGYTASQLNGYYSNHHLNSGLTGRFEKGHVPANKGKHPPTVGRMAETQFKKGHLPHNTKPIGYERINKDGYVEVKVKMRPSSPLCNDNFAPKHRLIWEAVNGPIPKGHKLIFADGDKTNITLDNLLLITDAQMARLNQNHLIQPDKELTVAGLLVCDVISKAALRKKETKRRITS